MGQPVPTVSADDVERIIRRDFSAEQYDAIVETLGLLGQWGNPRTQLAVLKLAAGNLERLAVYVKAGRSDFRDVLMWAEYPQANKKVNTPRWRNEAIREAVYASDWEQYQAWLNRP